MKLIAATLNRKWQHPLCWLASGEGRLESRGHSDAGCGIQDRVVISDWDGVG